MEREMKPSNHRPSEGGSDGDHDMTTGCAYLPDTVTRAFSLQYIKNNKSSVAFFCGYLVICIGLIIGRFYTYDEYILSGRIAKSAGNCLNFTCSMIVVMMLKKGMTLIRSTSISFLLPLDQSIYYHKLFGYFILIFSISHTLGHIFHFSHQSMEHDVSIMDYLFTVRDNGWTRQISPVTGWFLLVILIIMIVTSLPCIRRSGYFEVFFWCHSLYVLFYLILIIHAPNFIYWFLIPGICFGVEMFIRCKNAMTSDGMTYITQGVLLPSRVIHLVIKRPPNFSFTPGDFVYIKIPTIAKMEYHPFTISSAPELQDNLHLHIRAVGEWTNSLFSYFEQAGNKLLDMEGVEVVTNVSTRSLNYQRGSNKAGIVSWMRGREETSPPIDSSSMSSLNGTATGFRFDVATTGSVMDMKNRLDRILSTPNETKPVPSSLESDPTSQSMVEPGVKQGHRRVPFGRTVSCQAQSWIRSQSRVYVLPKPRSPCVEKKLTFGLSNRKRFSKMVSTTESTAESTTTESLSKAGTTQSHENQPIHLEKPLHLVVEGPYGSPSSHIFNSEHAVLVATGIGVTPFASILQSIMMRYTLSQNECPNCSHRWFDNVPANVMTLKKVDFVWINRDQKSFEWFVSLLSDLELTQALMHKPDRFLDIHMYVTSAKSPKAIGLQMALDMMHEGMEGSLITGLKTRTKPGRPDWNMLFQEIADQQKGRVAVYFCGSPQLGKIIETHCLPFGFRFRKENF